ncbi:MAG: hypothetical protein HYV40_02835 [Candidatus Levybacteria bacterium]|nr:hypothetical protein [Candidatus Levybacteria bacterium]
MKRLLSKLRLRLRRETPRKVRHPKKTILIALDKRQKFVIGVLILSVLLFVSEFYHFRFSKSGFLVSFGLSVLSDIFLYWAIRSDLPKQKTLNAYTIFILPFFYTLAFTLFYFLVPARILSRVILTGLYAIGLYSLYLCQNIFTVGVTKTIQLLSGARIVSFVLTLLSLFFLMNILFTLHFPVYVIAPFIFIITYLLMYQSIWTYAMQPETTQPLPLWTMLLTLCVLQVAIMIWFWPSTPTISSLFLTGLFYTIVGLSHVWFDRRLFRGVLWEYVWVSAVVFFVLILATPWGK